MAIGTLTLLFTAQAGLPPQIASAAEAPRVLDGVHTDAISADIVGKQLQLFTYADVEEGNRTRLDPAKTVFYIPSNSSTQVQVPAGYEFIAEQGKTIWLAPQTQVPGVLWPGWNTEDIGYGEVQGDKLTMELVDAQTPAGASVEVFQTDIAGQAMRIWSSDENVKKYQQPVHAHVHSNWAFTAEGVYKLTFQVSGVLADGTPVSADQTYTFAVGGDPTKALEPTTVPEPTAPAETTPTPSLAPAPTETTEPTPSSSTPSDTQSTAPTQSSEPTPAEALPPARVSPSQEQTVPAPASHSEVTKPEETAPHVDSAPSQAAEAQQPVEQPPLHQDQDGAPETNMPAAEAPQNPFVPGSQNNSDQQNSGSTTSSDQSSHQCIATEVPVENTQAAGVANRVSSQSLTTSQPTSLPAVSITTVADHTHQDRATEGHFDFGAVLSQGHFSAQVKDDRTSPAKWVDPMSLNFVLGDAAKTKLPAGMDYIDKQGSDVWLIGATQQDGVPWLGWNTQNPELVQNMDGKATMKLDSVTGPGKMAVFLSGNFGAAGQKVFDSDNLGSFEVPKNTHQHGNWAFTAPGHYTAHITWSVKLKDGSTKTASSILNFEVGNAGEQASENSAKDSVAQNSQAQGQQSATDEQKHIDQQSEKKAKPGSVDQATGIVTKPDGSQVKIVGKTADGADCTLSPEELASAQQASSEGRLASTGARHALLFATGGSLLVIAGIFTVYTLRRRSHA